MSSLTFEKSPSTAKSVLWHTRCPVPTAFSLAWELGSLEREFRADGIEWKSLRESGDSKLIQSHFSHTQEDSFRQGGSVPALWAKSRGARTRLIGLSWVETPYPILALPDSGIEAVADLKGKRLLVVRRSKEQAVDFVRATTLRTYEVALESAGLSLRDVELVEVQVDRLYADAHKPVEPREKIFSRRGGQKEAIASLLRREVDVIALQLAASLDVAALIGAKTIVDVRELPLSRAARTNNGAPRTLTVSADLAEQEPELVARVVAHSWKRQPGRSRTTARSSASSHVRNRWRRKSSNPFTARSWDARSARIFPRKTSRPFGPRAIFFFATVSSPRTLILRSGSIPRPLQRAREILAERHAQVAAA